MSSPGDTARIASLDGLRGVCALLVMIGHGTSALSRNGVLAPDHWFLSRTGTAGVTVLFAMSGFLVTTLLLREEDETGRASLRDFYVRRAFRILPAYWAFLGIVGVLAGAASAPLLARCALFLTDYLVCEGAAEWTFGHTWSLSLLEQFYLTWPPVLVLLGRRRALAVAIAVVVAAPAVRLASALAFPSLRTITAYMFHTRIDSVMIGCVLALVRARAPEHRFLATLADRRLGLAAALLIFFGTPIAGRALVLSRIPFGEAHLAGLYGAVLRHGIDALAAGAVVAWVVADGARGLVGRVLAARPLAWVGGVSYGLYLWQQVFFAPAFDRTGLTTFPLNVALAFGCAWASYRLVEAPALRLRTRFVGRAGAVGRATGAVPPAA